MVYITTEDINFRILAKRYKKENAILKAFTYTKRQYLNRELLAELLNVSRPSIDKALRKLVKENKLERRKDGSIVLYSLK